MSSMKSLVEFMAKSIVNDPDAVSVEETQRAGSITLLLSVAVDDMGRIIGKQGRVANAMRTLVRVAAIKEGKRASLEIG
jgi:uncharacterized protein